MKKAALIGLLYFSILLFSGCALTQETVTLSYTPQISVDKIAGADSVMVKVEVSDVRTIRDKVSCKKNGYGMEMASIVATNDVAQTLQKAIEAELVSRGFSRGDVVLVFAELQKFYNDFKSGFWSWTALSEVTMNIQVKKKDGSILFSKVISAEGKNEGIQLASGENARIALDEALKNSVAMLMSEKAFINAIIAAKN
jgi:uncharacterized lipoprotein YajG